MLSDEFTRDCQLAIDDVPVENNVELCTFRRNEIFLPPDILFQVKFLSQMSRHCGNDLNIHSEILELIKNHAQTHSADFSTLQIMSRQTLIRLLTTHYRLDFLKPTQRKTVCPLGLVSGYAHTIGYSIRPARHIQETE